VLTQLNIYLQILLQNNRKIRSFSCFAAEKRVLIRSKKGVLDSTLRKNISTDRVLFSKQDKILEIKTRKGDLIIRTTVSDGSKNVENLVIEKKSQDNVVAVEESAVLSTPNAIVTMMQPASEKEKLADKNKELAKKRKRVDFALSSLERNFITANRAMSDFLLKASDLESLPKTKRRSPYEQEQPITVYWRKDVEAKAIEIYGSRENLLKECLKKELEKKEHQQNAFTMKRRLRDYRREMGARTRVPESELGGLRGTSGKVVLTAIAINATNFLFKCFAWAYTGFFLFYSIKIVFIKV
jgi:zinc transporter 9